MIFSFTRKTLRRFCYIFARKDIVLYLHKLRPYVRPRSKLNRAPPQKSIVKITPDITAHFPRIIFLDVGLSLRSIMITPENPARK